jgi:hypothetical protein
MRTARIDEGKMRKKEESKFSYFICFRTGIADEALLIEPLGNLIIEKGNEREYPTKRGNTRPPSGDAKRARKRAPLF